MKKIIIFIIVFCSFCFIKTADAQTNSNCLIGGYVEYAYGEIDPFAFPTSETSRTLVAANELFLQYFDSIDIPECSDNCCTSGIYSVCTDGLIYIIAERGEWDVVCDDADLDGIPDDGDNCPAQWNPNQVDSDSDSIGNWCDNCPNTANPNQEDVDSDGTGDFCDNNTIFGHVSDYYFGDAQKGITVNIYILSCGIPQPHANAITDAQGYYAIGDLPNDRYLVGPDDAGYSFSSSKWVDISQAEIQSYDFTATMNCPCDDVDRYLDNGDGTVTDCRTCLIWLKDVSCLEVQGVEDGEAELNSGECGLSDGSVEGDWRRPTPTELQSVLSAPPTSWVGEPPPDTFRFPIAYFYIDSNETKAIWTSLVNYYDEVYFQFIFGEYGEPWGVGMWEHPYENNGWVPAITGLWPVR
jgi:hypothetical protein